MGASDGNVTSDATGGISSGTVTESAETQLLASDATSSKVLQAVEIGQKEWGESHSAYRSRHVNKPPVWATGQNPLQNTTYGGSAYYNEPIVGFRSYTNKYNISGTGGGRGVWMVAK